MSGMKPLLSCGIAQTRLLRTNVLSPCQSRLRWLHQSRHAPSQQRSLPRIAQTSIWDSIIPKAFRNRPLSLERTVQTKPTNPATYFIWIYILIGSQAIRIMGVKNEFMSFSRRADIKIEKLREVVTRLQNGEEVDVEKILGTGDEKQEREWEEVLEELQREDRVWQSSKKKSREVKERQAKEERDANPVNDIQDKALAVDLSPPSPNLAVPRSPGFY
ncbi:uncharacterized protein Z519_01164 [Cladophialophora bantiana CBS 173.52]|uniref:Uncharacterized protein n=1 Tax=Cladophialophora bantiana (strain ATCC 10958 / CBS 173.52 / CDC B-1940 / NIH 8579) TaxID=1442370 RepID=A0A0D2I327_CLAB1|nr:uncharacterized protein Z519_01164 [Cladophialophora bantiana CBS 173.52]KIW97580.1 hypothetical protein Z519_01164 [Cladophialophora bantiana CBS 173.52]